MRRGTPRRSEQNQSLDEEIGKIPEQLLFYFLQAARVSVLDFMTALTIA
jgi:hypothetical protein